MQLQRDVCADFERARQREWLETNGMGGFACSTLLGMNTRRYHSLLTAALHPPVGRFVLLSKLEESLTIGGAQHELSTNQYPGTRYPRGFEYLHEFRLDPFPTFTYRIGNVVLEKSIFMVHGENTTIVEYRLLSEHGPPNTDHCFLDLRPLLAFRDYHHTTRQNDTFCQHVDIAEQRATVRPYEGLPPLHFAHNAAEIDPRGHWYFNFEYEVERERGLDCVEDLCSPFSLRFDLTNDATAVLIASLEDRSVDGAPLSREKELARRARLGSSAPVRHPVVKTLTMAADQFIVKRGDQKTILAGYPWFSDWGRDTMIALPGLTLATGWHETAKSILREFARYVDQGMIPNRFPDAGETPDYNTVDATLWFFEAVRSLVEYTEDIGFVREHLYEVLVDIVEWHERGTRYGIRVDADGLLIAGEPGTQLTWMDAKVGDWVVTPRCGKPVEIQALWYNALCVSRDLSGNFGDIVQQEHCDQIAHQAADSFNVRFWNDAEACLYDVVTDAEADAAMRPNQILAVSLYHSMLTPERARQVVATVERELLTPYGLRSLSPRDDRYCGRYEGDQWRRDGAYHQGTVWAWLMGPFITAYLKVNDRSDAARQQASAWLAGLRSHLHQAGIGQVSEIFDGDPPHSPRGCFAQAWSVGELLRVLLEEQL
ncbi:MAG: hypothetical protein AUJ92_05865 [Armatimonadetes bacterium CG2_30_59_28]|nr:MAG: hypothetical protein AUJ92_05865 [Armatimonadetes bacterium CG2_30_59_28]